MEAESPLLARMWCASYHCDRIHGPWQLLNYIWSLRKVYDKETRLLPLHIFSASIEASIEGGVKL
jgi:hypothetical protein